MQDPQTPVCRYCGTPVQAGQRFCSNCGRTTEGNINQPTERSVDAEDTALPGLQPQTPPPPPTSYEGGQRAGYQAQNYQSNTPVYQPQVGYRPDGPPPMAQSQVPTYAKPTKDSSRSVLRQVGCGFLVVALLILGLCGGAGYFVYHQVSGAVQQASSQHTTNTYTSGNTNTTDTKTVSTPVVTTLNIQPITYSSVKFTIQNVQQASNFTDDDNNTSGVLRITLSEENTSTNSIFYSYSDSMLLLLPDSTSVHPNKEQYYSAPDTSVKRTNWIDFPVSTSIKPDQLTLRIGTANESQMDIPLKSGADVSKYQPVSSTPNKILQYAGANWTITKATRQTSYGGKQADKGNVFVVVDLKIDNNSDKTVYPSPSDVMRLQSGNTVNKPDSNTLESSIAPGQTNSKGACAFIMPADSTDFTFIFLPNALLNTTQQVTGTFQIK
ncbi:DUF4352 domain-containing protein [Dictyobacter aurantiacus]|uniref:Zinc-ribbon domain-containing protein n=1 Tax=Dictyobacter aurantiacus TaxID=1936993 RepID=A0A401ZNN3_9CHLR|nr:DUF4352 domain-containing protein [Dictyobacter aurantiacus]GCE08497.1 hypothetical protein KDAU_58260 [Dictyobacter aurantiacus]